MTRRLALAAALGVAAGVGSPAGQQASFSARVDTVRVDIDVRRGDRPVAGLTGDDFEIFDNGVRQKVELMSSTALPVSVVLALDTSASLDQKERAHLVAAGTAVIDALRPAEAAALVTFSERIVIPSGFTADTAALRRLVAAPTESGDTALHDAAHAAMLLGTSAPGRSIVILFSDGDDTASFLSRDAVIETAQRTGSVVCVVMTGGEGTLLQTLAETTGGQFVKERSLGRVAARFAEILESFRHRYLVSFTPTNVERAGWHTLAVRVRGGGEVRARTGYWAAPAAPGR
jgi:Ca-activated chloride channel family protein